MARYEVVDAISVEPIEDEGGNWFLRLRDGGVLFLSGQELGELEQAGTFPSTTVEVSRAPRARIVLDVNGAGARGSPTAAIGIAPAPITRAPETIAGSDGWRFRPIAILAFQIAAYD